MKIIVLGNGNAGSYIYKFLSKSFDCILFTHKDFDATSIDFNFLKILSPGDIVINCVGILKPKIKEVGIENTFLINSTFPNNLNKFCLSNNCIFIHICSDCVFSGNKGSYNENDITDGKDIYALSKKLVKSGTIIRTSFIGKHSGLLKWVLDNKNKTIEGYDNCIWNGVTALELAKFIKKNILNNTLWTGVRHLHSPETITKYNLCKLINDIYSLNINIKKVLASSIENQKINKILDRSLSTKYNLNITSLEKQLKEMKIFDEEYS